MAMGKVGEIYYAKEIDIEKHVKNELCHKIHEVHQQNIKN
jgi:hypothetical protein